MGTPVIFGWYENWATYRPGAGACWPTNLNPSLMTHLFYAFAAFDLSGSNVTIVDATYADWKSRSPSVDLYAQLRALKQQNPHLRLIFSIGGWNFSQQSNFWSAMTSSPALSAAFVSNAIAYAQSNGFDGIDLDWEYPETQSDLDGFASVLQALHTQWPGGVLTIEVSGSTLPLGAQYSAAAYQAWLKEIAPSVSFVDVMTYDYNLSPAGAGTTGVNAPLSAVTTSITAITQSVPSSQVVLGLPAYGHTYLVSPSATSWVPGQESTGPGPAGQFTQQPGLLAYYEIESHVPPFTFARDATTSTPYGYDDGSLAWVSFDDGRSLAAKVALVGSKNLAGVMIWSLCEDDFQHGFPLLTAAGQNVVMPGLQAATPARAAPCR
jgi:chitinase